MVGLPKSIRALYVDQLDAGSGVGSVLEAVMAADRDVLRWRQQAAALQVGALGCHFACADQETTAK